MRAPLLCLLLAVPLLRAAPAKGTKFTVRTTQFGQTVEHTTYFQGDRLRMEYQNYEGPNAGPHLAMIMRCDLGQIFELNLDANQYDSAPFPPKPYTKEQIAALKIPTPLPMPKQKTLRIETTTVDTRERKQMFGQTARHVITTTKDIPLSGKPVPIRVTVEDGWYIDFDPELSCQPKPSGNVHGFLETLDGNTPPPNPEFVDIGKPERGFALWKSYSSDFTTTFADGTTKQDSTKFKIEVVEFHQGPLDSSLFEIPGRFRQVAHIHEGPPPVTQTQSSWDRFIARISSYF